MAKRQPLRTWTIYKHPLDHPDKYVVRGWIDGTPDRTAHVADTLDEARDLVPAGLTRFPRNPEDDPVIVETWL